MFARFGRYGPMVQIGDAGDDAKPDFASLLPGQEIDRITLEEALKLFTRMRQLGTDPASGRPVFASRGRYGPFVQLGARGDKPKPAYSSLLPSQEVDRITLEEALQLLRLPRDLGETEAGEPVSAGIGRLGPYVRYGKTYVSLREDNPCTIELQRALELIAQHVASGGSRGQSRGRPEADSGIRGSWHHRAQRPLRALRDRRQEKRQRSQGPPAGGPDTGRMQGTHRGGAGTPQARQAEDHGRRPATAVSNVRKGRLIRRHSPKRAEGVYHGGHHC